MEIFISRVIKKTFQPAGGEMTLHPIQNKVNRITTRWVKKYLTNWKASCAILQSKPFNNFFFNYV